ncbi:MAG: cysteine desulfurase [Bacteroides sp.]|nr:cysteine desulfurase [Bacteroides sp.]
MDVIKIREEFPILSRVLYKRPMVYLDNTATSQTPRRVVDAVVNGYTHTKANVHRGVHTLSQEATELQESARRRVASWINAGSEREVIFTRGTTEALNLVASSMGGMVLAPGTELVLTVMEHHANIVPWQLLQKRLGFEIKVVPVNERGELDLKRYRELLTGRTRLVSVCHASNVLGTVNPVREMIAEAHSRGIPVVIDGAQAVPHLKVDVRELDADFYVFSAHKMYGPTGVGVLYGKEKWLEKMPPYQGGGEMIESVSLEKGTTFAELPYKFEAGTPDFIGISALSQAIDFMDEVGIEAIAAHEHDLLEYTQRRMIEEIEGMRIFGTAPGKCAIISFLVGNIHHYDMGMLLDKLGIEVRTGHHCAQPLMHALGVEGVVRASFAVYNTREEADRFIDALKQVTEMLR